MTNEQLQTLLKNYLKGDVQSVIGTIQSADGQVNLAGAVGNDPVSGQALTIDTPFFVASTTKLFTTAIIMKLHENGVINLDESISAYLPPELINGIHVYKGTDYSKNLKVYHLITMTSGLPDYFDDKPKGGHSVFDELKQGNDRLLNVRQMMDITRTLTPKFAPDKSAFYSDTNFQLLGAIIEAVTGKSIYQAYDEFILSPLGLRHTYLYNCNQPHHDPHPILFLDKGQPLNIPNFMTSSTVDGGIVSTAPELQVFLQAFFGGQLFDKALLPRMTARWNRIFFPFQYGYGVMRFKLSRIFNLFRQTPEFIGHSGVSGAFAFYLPERELYFVGTTNQISSPRQSFMLLTELNNLVK